MRHADTKFLLGLYSYSMSLWCYYSGCQRGLLTLCSMWEAKGRGWFSGIGGFEKACLVFEKIPLILLLDFQQSFASLIFSSVTGLFPSFLPPPPRPNPQVCNSQNIFLAGCCWHIGSSKRWGFKLKIQQLKWKAETHSQGHFRFGIILQIAPWFKIGLNNCSTGLVLCVWQIIK